MSCQKKNISNYFDRKEFLLPSNLKSFFAKNFIPIFIRQISAEINYNYFPLSNYISILVDRWPCERVAARGDAEVDEHEVHVEGKRKSAPSPPRRTARHQRSRTETKALSGETSCCR